MRRPGVNISTKLYLGFGTMVALGVGVAAYASLNMSTVGNDVRSMSALAENFQSVLECGRLLEVQRRAEFQFGVDGVESTLTESRGAGLRVLSVLDAMKTTLPDDRRKALDEVASVLKAHEQVLDRYAGLSELVSADREKLILSGEDLMTKLGQVTDRSRTATDEATVKAADDVERAFLLVRVSTWRNIVSIEKKGLLNFKRSVETARASTDRLAVTSNEEVKALILVLNASLASYEATFEGAFSDRTSMSTLLTDEMIPQTTTMLSGLQTTSQAMQADFMRSASSGQSTVQETTVVQVLLAIALLAVGGSLSILISRGIAIPITAITGTMRSLAGGDLDVAVSQKALIRRDEIGSMADAVNVFRANGLRMRASEREAAGLRQRVDAERAHVESEKAMEAAKDQVAITALAQALEKLMGGDLTFRIEAFLDPKTQRLKDDYNRTTDRLNRTLGIIAEAASTIEGRTSEISHGADDLARRTERQAASLEETVGTLDEITATVRQTSVGSLRAHEAVSAAKDNAVRSGEIVEKAVDAMNEIQQSSDRVRRTIAVIDEIAFQTNLLALNAGIEAARAGESGRGFAVVASEVRALAQRCTEAAKEVGSMISTSGEKVSLGVALVGETGDALRRIVVQVSDIDRIVADIAASAQEQADGLAQVNRALNDMDRMTQQNAAMVEQSTASSHELARKTIELSELVNTFKITRAAQPWMLGSSHGRPDLEDRTQFKLTVVGGTGAS